jgi:hypothetical protein
MPRFRRFHSKHREQSRRSMPSADTQRDQPHGAWPGALEKRRSRTIRAPEQAGRMGDRDRAAIHVQPLVRIPSVWQ